LIHGDFLANIARVVTTFFTLVKAGAMRWTALQ
jgi:hypothetical protein